MLLGGGDGGDVEGGGGGIWSWAGLLAELTRDTLLSLPHRRHLLNVTWEGRDFSFSPGGYLVQPTMVVIALNRHRLWEMVRRG